MPLFKKNKPSYRNLFVQKYKQAHADRIKRKRFKFTKMIKNNISFSLITKYKPIIIGISLIVVIGGGIGILFFSNFFNLSTIVVERSDITTNILPLQQRIETLKGKNIFFINENDVTRALQKEFPEYNSIQIYKLLPHTIKAKVSEYPIVARIKTLEKKEIMFLNEIGMIRNVQSKQSDLPLIEYKSIYEMKNEREAAMISPFLTLQDRNNILSKDELQNLLESKRYFEKEFSIKVPSLQYYPLEREIHLATEKGFSIWIDLNDAVDEQLGKLKRALQDFNITKIDLSYIDLRIKNKILYCTKKSACATK